jgi:hypothetical protein
MRASGLGLELEPGDRRAAPCSPSPDTPKRQRLLAGGIDLHPPANLVIEATEREVNRSLFGFGRASDNRPIGLGDLALLE